MSKGTPDVRKYMHKDLQDQQIGSVGITQKIWGKECNPKYNMSPDRFHSNVLEERVFSNDIAKKKNKKRPKSASSKQALRK